jgi:hypothetical protein
MMIREPVSTIAFSIRATKKSRKTMRRVVACSEHEIYWRKDDVGCVAAPVPIHATAYRGASASRWKSRAIERP